MSPPVESRRVPRTRRLRDRRVRIAAAVALLAVVSLIPVRGLWLLHTGHGVDMQTRWQETQYLLRGVDPNTRTARVDGADVDVRFDDLAFSGREVPEGVYPPWSYVLALPLLAPPTLDSATLWFTLVNAALVAALALWAGAYGWRVGGPATALACALALLALDGIGRTLVVGNYGVVVLALLAASLVALERGRAALAGALFGAALLKPTLAGPFALAIAFVAFARDRRGVARAAGGALAVLLGASLAFWWMSGTDPLTSLLKGQSRVPYFVTDGGGSTVLWRSHLRLPEIVIGGFHLELAQYAGMALALALGAAAAFAVRRARPLEQFGLASVVAMTWTYHRPYDSLLLVFLLLALLRHALPGAGRGARVAAALGTGLVGFTLWLPSRYLGWPDSTSLVQAVWVGGGLALVALVRRETAR